MSTEWTCSIPEGGKRFFGLSRNASYAAADRGELITTKVGKLRKVVIKAMERKLGNVSEERGSAQ